MNKIIVTGGTGYIGSHVIVDLIKKGYNPIIIDNLVNSKIAVLDGIEKITGHKPIFENIDLKNKIESERVFKKHSDSLGVIHFAALKAVGESVENPLEYYENNIQGLLNVLSGMKKNDINFFIFSSSCTVYGEAEELPVTESSPIKPAESPYGNTKQIGEEILRDYTLSSKDFSSISLRYFNPIGAHESGLIGEEPQGVPSNLLPYITKTATGQLSQLNVFGNDYPTHDGTAIRDYIHVCDLSNAHLIALERLINKKNDISFDVFNLGSGNGYTVLEVIQSFEKSSGLKVNYKFAPRRSGDITAIYADNSKAKNILGWSPKYNLDDMTSSSWRWEQALNKSS